MRRTILALVASTISVAAGVARAADDDLAFARALAQRGYVDLADRVLRRTAEDASMPVARRAASRVGLAQLRRLDTLRAARSRGPDRPSPESLRRLFDAAETTYRALLADSTTARAARIDFVRLLLGHAETASKDTPVAPLLDEALLVLSDAETASSTESASAAEGSPERARADDETAAVRMLRIQVLETKGVAASTAGRPDVATLTKALDEIEKFAWDYAGSLRCASAFRMRGLVLASLGKTLEACESLRDAAGAVSERDGIRGGEELVLPAYDDLARIATEARGADADGVVGQALAVIERLETDWPHHLRSAAGRRARISAAKLHARAGDRTRSVADACAVLAAAGDDDVEAAEDACVLLADEINARGVSNLDPAILVRVARASARAGDLRRTVNVCRATIAACRTPETRDQAGWDAWDVMGRAYAAAGRWYEAFLAFDKIERAWREDPVSPHLSEITDSTAYYRADALAHVASLTKDDADREDARRAVEDLARDHPGSAFAAGARGESAFRALSEASALRRAGDREGAAKRCREALAGLTSIAEGNPLFERAQALVPEAHRQLGETDDAVRLADAWLEVSRATPASPAAKRVRDQSRAQVLVTLLTATADRAAAVADPAARAEAFRNVLETLARREAEFVATAARGQERIDAWRAEALIATGDLDAATPLILDQTTKRPPPPNARYLAAAAAAALSEQAAKLRAAGDGPKARDTSLAAARLWTFVLDTADVPDGAVARDAAGAFAGGGDFAHAADLYSLASGLLRTAAAKSTDAAEAKRLREEARAASIDLARSFIASGRFADARNEAGSLLLADDESGASAIAKLSVGESLRGPDVDWLVQRGARSRPVVDVLAAAYSAEGSRDALAAAAQIVAALRFTLPRNGPQTAQSVDLALRHADALVRLTAAGGPADAALSAGAVLDDTFDAADALERAEELVPGAKRRLDELRRLVAAAQAKR